MRYNNYRTAMNGDRFDEQLTWHASAMANPPPSMMMTSHASFLCTVFQSSKAGAGATTLVSIDMRENI